MNEKIVTKIALVSLHRKLVSFRDGLVPGYEEGYKEETDKTIAILERLIEEDDTDITNYKHLT
jgi:hypothetical protein